jgi:ATP-binding cassette, subfamily C, type I secretion system permease/ATPase
MYFLRWLGILLLTVAVFAIGWDSYRSFSGGDLLFRAEGFLTTSTRDLLVWSGLERFVLQIVNLSNWPILESRRLEIRWLADAPLSLLLAGLGGLCWLSGRKRRKAATQPTNVERQGSAVESQQPAKDNSELGHALWSCRKAFLGTAAFSFVINILMLTGAVFMLEIYDRVLPSRSIATLIGLCIVAVILFTALGLLDVIRGRLLVRAGSVLNENLGPRIFDVLVRTPVRVGNIGGIQPLRDLDAVRNFLSGPGPTALFDMPWLPFYIGIVYLFHPLLGITAMAGAFVLICLTALTELLSRRPTRDAMTHSMSRNDLAEASQRNAEVLAGMGFSSQLSDLWLRRSEHAQVSQQRGSDIAGGLGAIARVLRLALQSAVLAMGAYLVILQEASAGIIIAGSILTARALAPIDLAIANWRGFVAARQSWQRLDGLFEKLPALDQPTSLPPPSSRYQVEGVVVAPPGQRMIVMQELGFALNKGQALAIIGPSGSGKSSLARVLVGAWLPIAGRIRLDGAALDQWSPKTLGRHIGYVPQGVELFGGTVIQNIARFDPVASPEAVIKAAKAADVHELIVSLPKGYDTEIGDNGAVLSAGQRQRVALARALYGDPFLVVLDEPDASLDQQGEQALRGAILGVRARGGIAIVVSHRQAALAAVDMVLAVEAGRPIAFGPKDPVLQKLAKPAGDIHVLKSMPEKSVVGPGGAQA